MATYPKYRTRLQSILNKINSVGMNKVTVALSIPAWGSYKTWNGTESIGARVTQVLLNRL